MSGDQIVGVVAIMAMLLLVVARLANDRTPRRKMLRMALLWGLIAVTVTVIVVVMKPQP